MPDGIGGLAFKKMQHPSGTQRVTFGFQPVAMGSRRPQALAIAGFDPSSGAGVTADLKVFAAHNIYGMAAITGLTVQSTLGVQSCQPVDHALLHEMLECLAKDANFDGVKIGMTASSANLKIIRDFLVLYKPKHIVWDPILHSTSGMLLNGSPDIRSWADSLLPAVSWITPNINELEALSGKEVRSRNDVPKAAKSLQNRLGSGQLNLLVTGGHLLIPEDYVLTAEGEEFWVSGKKVETTSTHGTGCTLSSSFLSHLIHGDSPREAAEGAKLYVTRALETAYPVGKGHGPLNHLFILDEVLGSEH